MTIKDTSLQRPQPRFKINIDDLRTPVKPQQQPQQTNGILEMLKKTQEENTQKTITAIINKLYSGKRLSPEELKFLQEHAPEMYEEAVKIMRAREELERQMEEAKTKEQVEIVRAAMTANLIADTKANPSKADMNMAILEQFKNAYDEYTNTEHYKKKQSGTYDIFEDG
ncbi:MAG: hypothetical protein FWD34_05895 [Oscillospiraceae bacterium]|nr:hypothetical protein [Oscillospiraceae bacterium]